MLRTISIVCAVLVPLFSLADPILIGIHARSTYMRATVQMTNGSMEIYAGDSVLITINKGQSADITASGSKVSVFFQGKNYSGHSKLEGRALAITEFKVIPSGQKSSTRLYTGDLIAQPAEGRLQLINRIEIENYVAGVIEAEGGAGHQIEYYKVQAVISRTYALNNLNRHQQLGFDLCDATHCQVYQGRPRHESQAETATENTKDIVIVDPEIKLITATFHSNCGGHTNNAEDVWSKPVTYLVGKKDTFCTKMDQAFWTKTFAKSTWSEYIRNNKVNYENLASEDGVFLVNNPQTLYWIDSSSYIPLRKMREDLKLRSTKFTVTHQGDQVVLRGRGFGHGVGLCQEG
ncbi:MAG: SpoIID/LytB domain-containing protein, partial [Flavobacteriales bacterium]